MAGASAARRTKGNGRSRRATEGGGRTGRSETTPPEPRARRRRARDVLYDLLDDEPPPFGGFPQPPDATPTARAIYRFLFGEPWERGWTVYWSPYIARASAFCVRECRFISISVADHYYEGGLDLMATLVHELLHVRYPDLRHGRKFNRMVRECCARLPRRYHRSVERFFPPPRPKRPEPQPEMEVEALA